MLDRMRPRTVANQIQTVGQGVRVVQIEHRWRHLVAQRQDGKDGSSPAGGAQHMAQGRFGGGDGGARAGTKHLADGGELAPITDRGGGGMRIEVLDISWLELRLAQGGAHGAGGA